MHCPIPKGEKVMPASVTITIHIMWLKSTKVTRRVV